MKKILPFFVIILMLSTACSKDDSGDSSSSYVKFKINGTSKNFKHVESVKSESSESDSNTWLQYSITTSEGANRLNQVDFSYTVIPQNNYIGDFSITIEGITYETMGSVDPLNFTIEISESNKDFIKGYFAGKLYIKNYKNEDSESVTIEQGTFEIQL
ncbi:hypothetical protein [Flavobacterium sp. NKUCC04_CG]|uniref:hypothetical protein n=1 Tax=Flavobacterium sp. NKUCC04_CG TaxID=2842121 RepID=UPI001C5AF3D0|nr:hypothetical protein [Flavobacterium sp. NKUCC04_CG]MBW3519148.1 hypothetical protein [Flavobacterium sp. NKUCC04_CG]